MRNGKSIEKGSRTALVTGGGSGIGRCMARRLAALGYDLALAGSDAERLAETAAELMSRYGTDVRTFALDLATDGAAERLCRWADEERIEIDVLINNAGTFSFRDILSTPPERIRRMLYLHDMTVALTCRLLGERMAARGRGGYILNMASYSLWMPFPGLALYSASKAFVRSFSVAFAREVREAGIRVTAVCRRGLRPTFTGSLRSCNASACGWACCSPRTVAHGVRCGPCGGDGGAACPAGGTGCSSRCVSRSRRPCCGWHANEP